MEPLEYLLAHADPITWLLLMVFIARQRAANRAVALRWVRAHLVMHHDQSRETAALWASKAPDDDHDP